MSWRLLSLSVLVTFLACNDSIASAVSASSQMHSPDAVHLVKRSGDGASGSGRRSRRSQGRHPNDFDPEVDDLTSRLGLTLNTGGSSRGDEGPSNMPQSARIDRGHLAYRGQSSRPQTHRPGAPGRMGSHGGWGPQGPQYQGVFPSSRGRTLPPLPPQQFDPQLLFGDGNSVQQWMEQGGGFPVLSTGRSIMQEPQANFSQEEIDNANAEANLISQRIQREEEKYDAELYYHHEYNYAELQLAGQFDPALDLNTWHARLAVQDPAALEVRKEFRRRCLSCLKLIRDFYRRNGGDPETVDDADMEFAYAKTYYKKYYEYKLINPDYYVRSLHDEDLVATEIHDIYAHVKKYPYEGRGAV